MSGLQQSERQQWAHESDIANPSSKRCLCGDACFLLSFINSRAYHHTPVKFRLRRAQRMRAASFQSKT